MAHTEANIPLTSRIRKSRSLDLIEQKNKQTKASTPSYEYISAPSVTLHDADQEEYLHPIHDVGVSKQADSTSILHRPPSTAPSTVAPGSWSSTESDTSSNETDGQCEGKPYSEDARITSRFREINGGDALHTFDMKLIGRSTAGVYIAQAISTDETASLFFDGRPFLLKLYNIEAAGAVQNDLGIDLSEEVVHTYLEMRKNGTLQSYVDFLSQEAKTSMLPEELSECFEEETITNADIAWYVLSEDDDSCQDLLDSLEATQHLHPNYRSPAYRLALGMLQIACTRHKEFAVHLYLQRQHMTSGLLPRMISFLKLETQSEFLGSNFVDAVAMELFEGASLLETPHNNEASQIFGQISSLDTQRLMQDVVTLGTCLLPLGLQQTDFASRNIFARFDIKSGYQTMAWIDLESLSPVEGNIEVRKCLETHAQELLKVQNSFEKTHFQLPLRALTRHLGFVKPYARLERCLLDSLDIAIRDHLSPNLVRQFDIDCGNSRYTTGMYQRFPFDSLTTMLYWTLMQSACKAFSHKPHLVTVYLQIIRYVINYHTKKLATQCHCWVRKTFHSINDLHQRLHLFAAPTWQCVLEEIVWPLSIANLFEIGFDAVKSSGQEPTNYLACLSFECHHCNSDLLVPPTLSKQSTKMYEDLRSLMFPKLHDAALLDAFEAVRNDDQITSILIAVSKRVSSTSDFFSALEGLDPEVSRTEFCSRLQTHTKFDVALADWRKHVLPAL